jgi:glycosyltransferase involved in cell wall biosynthesis
MRIIFQSRKTLFSVPGGDTTQILKTAEALRHKGMCVDITTDLAPEVSSYDIVHLFNLMRPQEVYLQAINAKKQGKKIALSTIYGPYTEYDRRARIGVGRLLTNVLSLNQIEYLKVLARAIVNHEINEGTWKMLSLGYRKLQEALIELVDVFLPNSQTEMHRVHNDFPISRKKPFVVVPNAVDTALFDVDSVRLSRGVEKFRGCVLCVARIEGRKCQLELVRAMRHLSVPLVLIGIAAPNHADYFERVRREAGPNVHFLGQIDHASLPEFYKAAAVHCLISWMETPGLSSLEAGAMDCNIVVTRKGDTYDYFGEHAFYCEPDSLDSIRNSIEAAIRTPVDPALRQMIRQKYSWEKSAEKTLEGYHVV